MTPEQFKQAMSAHNLIIIEKTRQDDLRELQKQIPDMPVWKLLDGLSHKGCLTFFDCMTQEGRDAIIAGLRDDIMYRIEYELQQSEERQKVAQKTFDEL